MAGEEKLADASQMTEDEPWMNGWKRETRRKERYSYRQWAYTHPNLRQGLKPV